MIVNDPEYMFELRMEYLIADLKEKINQSGIPKRQLVERLGTSESQLYRLFDPNKATKNFQQLFRLASMVGLEIEFKLKKAA